ncbi:MAG: hypothetical protein EOP06_06780 [Proteobacteria bacterium]|nr:MAG: hypothetical protein EOP06_06780 [Pseudomonadota bacterium]
MTTHALKIKKNRSTTPELFEDLVEKLHGSVSDFTGQHDGATTSWSVSGDTGEISMKTAGNHPTLRELKNHLKPYFAEYDSRYFPRVEYPVQGDSTFL